MPEQETVYCANCDAEATHRTPNRTPLCWTCTEAYKWGQASPEGAVTPIDEETETPEAN